MAKICQLILIWPPIFSWLSFKLNFFRENSSLGQQLEEALIQLRAEEMRQMELNVSNTEPSSGTQLAVELEQELEKRKQVDQRKKEVPIG